MGKKIICCILSMALIFSISIPAFAAENNSAANEEDVILTFTNEDFVNAARTAYSNGSITEEEWYFVLSQFSARLGVKGENKIVAIDEDDIDVYLNNVVWAAVTTLGTGAVAAIIAAIPGLNAIAAGVIGSLVGGISGAILSAENGVIIRLRMVDVSGGFGPPEYTYAFVSIREQ